MAAGKWFGWRRVSALDPACGPRTCAVAPSESSISREATHEGVSEIRQSTHASPGVRRALQVFGRCRMEDPAKPKLRQGSSHTFPHHPSWAVPGSRRPATSRSLHVPVARPQHARDTVTLAFVCVRRGGKACLTRSCREIHGGRSGSREVQLACPALAVRSASERGRRAGAVPGDRATRSGGSPRPFLLERRRPGAPGIGTTGRRTASRPGGDRSR
jgi:hypothetical protein